MPKTLRDIEPAGPLLDIASYARRGPGQRERLTPEEVQLIERTVRRTPEVMVKVLSRGGQDAKSVGRHFAYLSRKGNLEIETDDGARIEGRGAEAKLMEDWDLDIQEQRPTSALRARADRKPPKLVHKVLFSMPPGTPPNKVLEAVKVFAREEFGAKHRYAMVLHTDEPHPHVHLVVKAVSEHGARLNIRKATLRRWRRDFAGQLRAQGVDANATERAVRGNVKASKADPIFRAECRGASTHIRERSDLVAAQIARHGHVRTEGNATLERTRETVEVGWRAVRGVLLRTNQGELAATVEAFLREMTRPMTDQQQVALALRQRVRPAQTPQPRVTR